MGSYTTTTGFYGTFDMAGNVFEWEDTIHSGSSRVLRGGSWYNFGGDLRSVGPVAISPVYEGSFVGFRVASP